MPAAARLRNDGGFTLVELGMVLLILGVLLGAGLPAYRGVVDRTRDQQIQGDLRAAFQVQALALATLGAFSADEAVLEGLEPTLSYSALGAPRAVTVRLAAAPASGVCLFGLSLSGRWFSVYYSDEAATRYGRGSPPDDCTPALVAGWSETAW